MIITAIGDCGIDKYVDQNILRPGGCSLNFSVHARKLFPEDDSIRVISAIGTDERADVVRSTLADNNVEGLVSELEGSTALQAIRLESNGERTFVGYEAGVLSKFEMTPEQKKVVYDSDLLVTLLYKEIEPFFEKLIQTARTGLLAVDFMSLNDYEKSKDVVEKYIDSFDIGFFGLENEDRALLLDLQKIATAHRKLFVVTLGEQGSIAMKAGYDHYCPTNPIENVVDTTGAGDSFAAAFLSQYSQAKPLEDCLKYANKYAGKTVVKLGAF